MLFLKTLMDNGQLTHIYTSAKFYQNSFDTFRAIRFTDRKKCTQTKNQK